MNKFKVGDKVRIRKDLVVGKKYRKDKFVSNMEKYKGENAIIEHISIDGKYGLNIDDRYYNWTDEMLEPVKEVVEYQNKKYDVAIIEKNYNSPFVGKDCLRLTLKEHKEEILDDKEKEYLRNLIKYVIKPTKNKIKNITKISIDYIGNIINTDNRPHICQYHKMKEFFIKINFENGEAIPLPLFKDKRMYSGMKDNEPYTLEQLGL